VSVHGYNSIVTASRCSARMVSWTDTEQARTMEGSTTDLNSSNYTVSVRKSQASKDNGGKYNRSEQFKLHCECEKESSKTYLELVGQAY
jgi:hypothetical protein